MFSDVEEKKQKGNQILFSRNSVCLQNLLYFMRRCTHKELVIWAFELSQEIMNQLRQKYPLENRFLLAYQKTFDWAIGKIKMQEAKQAILDCHKVAKEITNPSDIALCHALGQGLSTVHVETHAIGICIYELTALVFAHPFDYSDFVLEKIKHYMECLFLVHENFLVSCQKMSVSSFAPFLEKNVPNREQTLFLRNSQNRIHAYDLYSLLEQLQIPYQEVSHRPVFTVEEATSLSLPISGYGVKNLFLKDSTNQYFLFMIPDNQRADFKKLEKFLQTSKIRFGKESELKSVLHLKKGSCTPFGIIFDTDNLVTLIVDQSLLSKRLLFHPNRNDRTLSMSCNDLFRFITSQGHAYLIFS